MAEQAMFEISGALTAIANELAQKFAKVAQDVCYIVFVFIYECLWTCVGVVILF